MTARVICTLPNASGMINGVRFVSHKMGMISEEIDDDVVDSFTAIKGFMAADRKGKPVDPPLSTEPAPGVDDKPIVVDALPATAGDQPQSDPAQK